MNLNKALYIVLTAGVVASSLLFAAGLLTKLAQPSSELSNLFLATGITILLLTPLAGVTTALIAFLTNCEKANAALAAIVLLIMATSAYIGAALHPLA